MSRQVARVALAVVLLAGLGVRVYRLGDRGFWFDEAFTWRMIQYPLAEMLERIGEDHSPPLHFLLLRWWGQIVGDSAIELRLLSVLFGMVTLVGVYLFCRDGFASPRRGESTEEAANRARLVGVCSAALIALSPIHVRFSWEARMYSQGTAFLVFASWMFVRSLAGGRFSVAWLVGSAGLQLAFLYTHYFAVFSIAGQMVLAGWVWVVRGNQRWNGVLRIGLFCAIVGVGYLPWLATMNRQAERVQGNFWVPKIERWEAVFHGIGSTVLDPTYTASVRPPRSPWEPLVIGGFVVTIWLMALLWRPRAVDGLVLVLALTPIAGAVVLSLRGTSVFLFRYLLFAHLFAMVGLAGLVCRLRAPLERSMLVALILVNQAWLFGEYWLAIDFDSKPGPQAAAKWLRERRKDGEPIFVGSNQAFLVMQFYLRLPDGIFSQDSPESALRWEGRTAMAPADYGDIRRWNADSQEKRPAGAPARIWLVILNKAMVPAGPWRRSEQQSFPSWSDGVVQDYRVERYEWVGEMPPTAP